MEHRITENCKCNFHAARKDSTTRSLSLSHLVCSLCLAVAQLRKIAFTVNYNERGIE